ncbi:unnamed protein product, partial [Closterium sp. Naga37s-1]
IPESSTPMITPSPAHSYPSPSSPPSFPPILTDTHVSPCLRRKGVQDRYQSPALQLSRPPLLAPARPPPLPPFPPAPHRHTSFTLSEKDGCSGQIPESSTPIITSSPARPCPPTLLHIFPSFIYLGVYVVKARTFPFARTTCPTPGRFLNSSACCAVKDAQTAFAVTP